MKKVIFWGMGISLFLAGVSFIASSWPDGLEKVAEDKEFIEKGEVTFFNALIPDYTFPKIRNERLATSVAGFIGVFIVFGTTYIFMKAFRKKAN